MRVRCQMGGEGPVAEWGGVRWEGWGECEVSDGQVAEKKGVS